MNTKQYRMLQILDEQITSCEKCNLYRTGRTKPYWTQTSKYVIIGEAPGRDEVALNTPFVGTAGKHLWEMMAFHDFVREDFLIINSVNCRPMMGNINGKPTLHEMKKCKQWIRKYIKVLEPKIILVMGNYAMDMMTGESSGITDMNATIEESTEYGRIILSVHPMMCIYSGSKGKQKLYDSIRLLRKEVDGNAHSLV